MDAPRLAGEAEVEAPRAAILECDLQAQRLAVNLPLSPATPLLHMGMNDSVCMLGLVGLNQEFPTMELDSPLHGINPIDISYGVEQFIK